MVSKVGMVLVLLGLYSVLAQKPMERTIDTVDGCSVNCGGCFVTDEPPYHRSCFVCKDSTLVESKIEGIYGCTGAPLPNCSVSKRDGDKGHKCEVCYDYFENVDGACVPIPEEYENCRVAEHK